MTDFATGGIVPGGTVVTAQGHEFVVPAHWLDACPCGHQWLRHDVDQYRGDGTEMCCAEGCGQTGCPGRSTDGAKEGNADASQE